MRRPSKDWLLLPLGGLAEVDPGDVRSGGGGEKLCSYWLRRRLASWASVTTAPEARPAVGDVLLSLPGHGYRDFVALAPVVPSIDGGGDYKVLPPP